MANKKMKEVDSPDVNKLQEVVINLRTKIYIEMGEDPVEAKKNYLSKHGNRFRGIDQRGD